MLSAATSFLNTNINFVKSYDEFKSVINKGGFVKCGWDGNVTTEEVIKKDTNATIRCIPFDQKKLKNQKCIYTNKPAKYEVVFAKAY